MAKKDTLRRQVEKQRADSVVDGYATFALEEAEDNKILRSSLWVAFGFHLLLLLINFPALNSETRAAPEREPTVHLVPTPIWKPPEVLPTEIPKKRTVKKPVPDPTPHEPEPLRLEETRVEVDLPEVDPDYFPIPEAPPTPEPEGPIIVVGEVNKPEKLSAPQPQYTEIARKARIQGLVIVQAIIDKNGDVTNVKVLKGLSMGLTEAAVAAVKQWKFKPATLRGKPVDVYYNLTINFSLQ